MKNSLESLGSQPITDRSDIKETVYNLLKRMIMRRDFTPNERIEAADIAEKLGISRTPVRDALNMLDAEGFIHTVPRQGIYVRGVYRQDLLEMFEYREMVELYALDKGFERLSDNLPQFEQSLAHFHELLHEEEYDGNEVMENDIAFHKLIVKTVGNDKIIGAYDKLNGHVQMARAYYLQERKAMHFTYMEHVHIVEAMRSGDKAAVRLRLSEHLGQTLTKMLALIDIYKVF